MTLNTLNSLNYRSRARPGPNKVWMAYGRGASEPRQGLMGGRRARMPVQGRQQQPAKRASPHPERAHTPTSAAGGHQKSGWLVPGHRHSAFLQREPGFFSMAKRREKPVVGLKEDGGAVPARSPYRLSSPARLRARPCASDGSQGLQLPPGRTPPPAQRAHPQFRL